jgi:hypothetical protein
MTWQASCTRPQVGAGQAPRTSDSSLRHRASWRRVVWGGYGCVRGVIGVILLIRLGFRVIQRLGFILEVQVAWYGTTPFHLANGVVTQNGDLQVRHRVW